MIRFAYKLDEHGWATSHISDVANSLEMYPSHITGGGIEELAERVVVLLKSDQQGVSTREQCSWGHEPGEYRWLLENDAGQLKIEIVWFGEAWSSLADEQGKLLFSTKCSLLKFAIQVKTQLRDEFADLGQVEYKRRAGREFPQRVFDELIGLIREKELQSRLDLRSGE